MELAGVTVLILILMEYPLTKEVHKGIQSGKVLILILMEYPLTIKEICEETGLDLS